MTFRPKYISFDCYGTLINYKPNDMAREIFADRVKAEDMPQFLADFTAYRLDEVLGPWQPLGDVLQFHGNLQPDGVHARSLPSSFWDWMCSITDTPLGSIRCARKAASKESIPISMAVTCPLTQSRRIE